MLPVSQAMFYLRVKLPVNPFVPIHNALHASCLGYVVLAMLAIF